MPTNDKLALLRWAASVAGASTAAQRRHARTALDTPMATQGDAQGDADVRSHSWYDSSFELRQGLDVIETNLDPLETHGALLPSSAWLQLMSKRTRRLRP